VDGVRGVINNQEGVVTGVDGLQRLVFAVEQGAVEIPTEVIFEVLLEQVFRPRWCPRREQEQVAEAVEAIHEGAIKRAELWGSMLPSAFSVLQKRPIDVDNHRSVVCSSM